MFDINLTRSGGRALLGFAGNMYGHDDADLVKEAFCFVQPSDHLILDLTQVEVVDREAAGLLYNAIRQRSLEAETVVVSPGERVSMPLVLHNVDRVTSIVRTVGQAVSILDRRTAGSDSVPPPLAVSESV